MGVAIWVISLQNLLYLNNEFMNSADFKHVGYEAVIFG